MNVALKPVAETEDTITFAKKALSAYLEDVADRAAIEQHLALREALGDTEFMRQTYSDAEVSRIISDNTSVVTILRERERLTLEALAEKAGVTVACLSEIESGAKGCSASVVKSVAKALRVPMTHLVD